MLPLLYSHYTGITAAIYKGASIDAYSMTTNIVRCDNLASPPVLSFCKELFSSQVIYWEKNVK